MWTHIALLACLASGLLAAPERPDAGLVCPRSQGLFSHPTNCHLFIHCDHDHPYVKECPANLHFNPKLMVCDWPENAGCTGGTPTEPPTPDVDPEPGMECDCECCIEPNGDDCTTYYICKDGKAYKASCAPGLVFNPIIDNCDLASNYKCDVKTTTPKPATTKPPTTPQPKPPTTTRAPTPGFDCPTSNGLFPNPLDCHTFYHCSNGHAYLKDCPANLEFNPVLLVCDWPENAGCNGKPTASPQPPQPTNPIPSDFDCPTSNGLFPNPLDCHTFYHCSNGYSYLKDCPANLEFNPVLLVCDWPENAGCSVKPTTPKPTTPKPTTSKPKPTVPSSNFTCPSDGLFPNPLDCHTFYHCSNGYAYLKDCPANLEFNPVLLVCDWPENAGCNGKPTASPQPPQPTNPIPSDFDCPTSNGLFPNPLDCHTFYHCSNGYSYLKDCPANLEFNPVLLVCDWPENAGCNGKTTPSPQPKPTTPTPSEFDCPTNSGLFPNPRDCHSFYQCSNGHAYLMQCPANLEFNPVLLVCDWPENAGCSIKPTTSKPTTPKPTTSKPKPTVPSSNFTCPSDGVFPNPLDCRTFYHCSNGYAYLKDCPANLEFNPVLLVCDWPENAGCGEPTPRPSPTENPPPQPTPNPDVICPNETCVCRVPDPENCACFYECHKGGAYKECCSPGLQFNKDTEVCDLPENVDCGPITPKPPTSAPVTTAKPAPTQKPPTPTEAPTCTFPCEKSDGRYGNPLNCGTFFECSGGQATINYCPSGKHFNTGTNSCDAPESAGCCELVPDPTDCNKFYQCKDGKAYPDACPAGLVFNPASEMCDLAENVPGCKPTTPRPTTPKPTQKPTEPAPSPSDFDCPTSSGLFPNPQDCHSFYQCSNGHAYLMQCPANLEFNPVLLVCDWPENAGCNGKTTPSPQPKTTTPTPSDFDCPTSNGLFPNPLDCHTFYHCSNGHTYLKDCPANLEFNPVLLVCDWPENAGCNGKTTPSPQPKTTTPTPSDFDCPTSNGLFPNPQDCNSFYQCSNGHAYLMQCPANLEFNPVLLVCDWPENAGCNGKTTPSPQPKTTTPTPSDFDCPTSNGLFPNPQDCHSFYHCSNGHAYLKDCPANLEFNPVLLVCDWPENAGCNGKTTPSPQPKTTTPTPSDFDCPTSSGLFPNPRDCHSFYQCSNGHAYLMQCPANLEFNPVLLVCDWPENAGCNGKTTPSPQPKTTTPTPSDFDCPTSSGLFPNPRDCHSFYQCSNGHAYLMQCPANLEFNPVLLVCDWPENAGCNGKTTPSPQPKTTTPTPSDFDCPTSNGLFPNPLDCHTFYHCSNGHAYLKDCPANLEFNPVLLVCDWPENAGCNGKTTPSPSPTPQPEPTPNPDIICPNDTCDRVPDPTDCNKFYQCKDGKAYPDACPAGLVFNPALEVCDFAEHVPGCKPTTPRPTTPEPTTPKHTTPEPTTPEPTTPKHTTPEPTTPKHTTPEPTTPEPTTPEPTTPKHTTPEPTTPEPTTPEPTTPEPTPNPDVICPNDTCACRVPDPTDCNKFYQCKDGKAYPDACPAGLVFNPASEMCDLAENVPGCMPTTPRPTTPEPDSESSEEGSGSDSGDSDSSESGSKSKHSGSTSKNSGSKSKESGSKSKNSGSKSKNSGSKSKKSGSKSKESGSKSKESGSKSKESGSKSKRSAKLMKASAPAQRSPLYRNPDHGMVEDDDGFLEARFCPSSNGKFASSRCRFYYHCVDGVPTLKRCLHGTRFYAPDQRCILGSC